MSKFNFMRYRWLIPIPAFLLTCLFIYFGGPQGTHAATSALTGTINDSQGNPINGTLTMQLPVAAQDTATNTAIAPVLQQYRVLNGVIQTGPPLYDVAGLQPKNLFYIAKVYDAAGNLILNGNYVVTGATFNFGSATPTTVTTSNISYVTPVVLSNANTFSATQAAPIFASTSTPLALSGFLRMANTDGICWRNTANNGDVCLSTPTPGTGAIISFNTPMQVGAAFGTNLTTTVIGTTSITANSQAYTFLLDPVQSVVGIGCSVASNTVQGTYLWTAPGGTAESYAGPTLTISGNGALDSQISRATSVPIQIVAKTNTNISLTTTSTLASTGCSTVPTYSIYTKVMQ